MKGPTFFVTQRYMAVPIIGVEVISAPQKEFVTLSECDFDRDSQLATALQSWEAAAQLDHLKQVPSKVHLKFPT